MDDNARPHRTLAVQELLESEDITRMDWPAYSSDLNPAEHVWDAFGRRIAARLHHPGNTQQLKQMLIEEWVLLPKNVSLQEALAILETFASDDDSAASNISDTDDENYVENVAQGKIFLQMRKKLRRYRVQLLPRNHQMPRIARHNDESVREGYIKNGGKEVNFFTSFLKAFQCNSHIVMAQRKHLDDFLHGRIIGRLEFGRTQLEVSNELGIAQSVISRL
ncbi:uncharacterized protein TNCV_4217801 [Trichonephila clavipes]|nr:uncharacterized protein TNCV_4217801 [Trichonephila clavipes]